MRTRYFIFLIIVALLTTVGVVAQEEKKTSEESLTEPAGESKKSLKGQVEEKKSVTPIALTMEAIQELEQRKKNLDDRERALEERAKALEVQEKILKDKLKRMEDLNRKMAERLDGFKKEHEEKITKLVNMVESMRPEPAARYIENLDPYLAVEILARIQVQRAAKILNLVDKAKGAKLTELYTGYRQSMDDAPAPQANNAGQAKEGKTGKM